MKRTMILLSIASLLVATAVLSARKGSQKGISNPPQDSQQTQTGQAPKVDLVIALDTSGSMSGLINAARQKLWDIVNEVAQAKPTPRLRVGLVTFGSQGSEQDGFVKMQSDLTADLDTLYSKLFELTTWGGTEYVGRAVHRSVKELSWDRDPDTLRQIYVAGNESADQDRSVTVSSALSLAQEHDIFVNAIYCGRSNTSDAPSWKRVAQQGKGMYASIDHNHGTIAIATPYDAKLGALSAKLNKTYVAYGRRGRTAMTQQATQDRNAASVNPGTAASRAVAKASGIYRNEGWDLVDAKKNGKLKKIKPAQLPAPLRSMSEDDLASYVEGKEKERAQIKEEIREIAAKRRAHIKIEMKRQGKSGDKSFDTAVKRALRKQAAKKKISL